MRLPKRATSVVATVQICLIRNVTNRKYITTKLDAEPEKGGDVEEQRLSASPIQ